MGDWYDKHIAGGSVVRGLTGESRWKPSEGRWGIFGRSKGRRAHEKNVKDTHRGLREQATNLYNPKLVADEQGIAVGAGGGQMGDYMGKLGEMSSAQEIFDLKKERWDPESGTEIQGAMDLLEQTKNDLNKSLMMAIETANQQKLSDTRTLEGEKVSSGMYRSGAREAMGAEMEEASDLSIQQKQVNVARGVEEAEGTFEKTQAGIESTYELDVLKPFEKAQSDFEFLTGESGLKQQYLTFLDDLNMDFFTPREDARKTLEQSNLYKGGSVGEFDTTFDTRREAASTMDFAKLVEKA